MGVGFGSGCLGSGPGSPRMRRSRPRTCRRGSRSAPWLGFGSGSGFGARVRVRVRVRVRSSGSGFRVGVGIRVRAEGARLRPREHGRAPYISPISPLYLPYVSPISPRARLGPREHGRPLELGLGRRREVHPQREPHERRRAYGVIYIYIYIYMVRTSPYIYVCSTGGS